MKVYVVTLRDRSKLEEFYQDMETPGGSLYIPNRSVDVSDRRPISRSTHYLLTDEEAELLRKDERVLSVEDPSLEPPPRVQTDNNMGDTSLDPVTLTDSEYENLTQYNPNFSSSFYFWKDSGWFGANTLNWGLVEHTKSILFNEVGLFWGTTDANADTGTVTTANARTANTISLDIPGTGKNVDVVIWDGGTINPAHPEFAVNADGTGGTRCVQEDWNSYTSEPAYTYADKYDNHATNVAGVAVGNRYGWARDANIYSMDFNIANGIDKLRMWHAAKEVNPATGVKNPTIVNMSWGSFFSFGRDANYGWPTSVNYRGTTYTPTDSDRFDKISDLMGFNLFPGNMNPADGRGLYTLNFWSDSFAADIADATAEGIIFVSAAGNYNAYCEVEGGVDWDNTALTSPFQYYINRCNKTSAPGVISVGAMDVTAYPRKTNFSNTGPRVDVWAAGRSIVSAGIGTGVTDLRDNSYNVGNMTGTSQASPQVCGILACIMEFWPNLTAEEAKQFFSNSPRTSEVRDSTFSSTDFEAAKFALRGAAPIVAFTKSPRPTTGNTWPNKVYKPRASSGAVYPRIKKTINK